MMIKHAMYAAVSLALLGLPQATTARAQNPGRTCVPFSGIFLDSCTGENIAVTADSCFVFSFHTDASGGQHVTIHDTIIGSGLGLTSGTQYRISEVVSQNVNVNGNNSQFEFNIVGHLNLISKGSMPNERGMFNLHVTVDANGDVTSSHVHFSDNCRG